jgi:thiamine-monophosphate kinase
MSGEDDLIARHFKPLASAPGALGLSDDAALFTPPDGCDLVLTKDALVAGVHFFPDDPPDLVARKALRVNLSDLAAKGAIPAGFLLALALTETTREAWLAAFARGLKDDINAFGCPLYGGDTVHTPGPVTISITAFGTVPRGRMVKRNGAAPGDRVLVTGSIGDAALGLRIRLGLAAALDEAGRTYLMQRYLLPQPRNALAAALGAHASAAMDISDGLAGDLAKLCAVSAVSARIDVATVPLSDPARALLQIDPASLETALTGGDDYEIVCTVPPPAVAAFQAVGDAAGIAVTPIGEIVAGDGPPLFVRTDGQPIAFTRMSFSHF